ncbi:MAG: hypothetical protein HY744_20405 [Deltaproteobacteria bacterium]|nr:hypothetical protein [Deltaproteobacteria bacterium]
MIRTTPDPDPVRARRRKALALAALAVLVPAVALVVLHRRAERPVASPPPPADAGAGAVASATASAVPRCVQGRTAALWIGEASPRPPAPVRPAGAPAGAEMGREGEPPDRDEALAPFAAELGRGACYDGGFAVGVKHQVEGGALAEVALMGLDGAGGRLVSLGRIRGDLGAPLVVAAKGRVVAAMLEPNAGGFALRLASVSADKVAWGAEIDQERDDSLGFDFAIGAERGVVVWDGVTKDGTRAQVMLAAIEPRTLAVAERPRPVSPPGLEAEAPRVVAGEGGFWLGYVVRAPSKKRPTRPAEPAGEAPDGRYPAESIEPAWVELMPLGADGLPRAASRAVTPRDGHVQDFDLAPSEQGAALLAWRDDDTPSGAHGGRLSLVRIEAGGPAQSQVMADDAAHAGAPSLLGGWLTTSAADGRLLLAALGPGGEALDELAPDPVLGEGELLAAGPSSLLLARPAGRGFELAVVSCRRPAGPGGGDTADAGGRPR